MTVKVLSSARPLGAAVRALAVLTLLLGLAYPLVVTAITQVAFPGKADGSLVVVDGRTVGSSLIGQNFSEAKWFHPRPSAAGKDGYDALASGASNLGPENPDLIEAVKQRRIAIAQANGVPESAVPADAVTASGSGLDPDISPAYARIQIERVARARGLDPAAVRKLVDEHTKGRALGFLGEARVNVLELNLALDRLGGSAARS